MVLNRKNDISDWLPVSGREAALRSWDDFDVILFSGDAYVDHPSFGTAVIGRVIEDAGFSVGIVPQPNWQDDLRDFRKLGTPRLFFGVSAGNMDSMVNHYTAFRRLRSDDAYTPGGKAGFRPDYTTKVYTRILKELFPDVPVVIGGVEASMRRIAHYDYWNDEVLPSVLYDSGADLLLYGMADRALRELLRLLDKGVPFENLRTIPQTGYLTDADSEPGRMKGYDDIRLPSFKEVKTSKKLFAESYKTFETESNKIRGSRLLQYTGDRLLVINPQYPPASKKEIDRVSDLPYTRMPHPRYNKKGSIPAWEMIKFSVNMHQGCFGGCSFCAISSHQGKFVSSRSEQSILNEIDFISRMPDFRGQISDMGGPSANMYRMKGIDEDMCIKCLRPSCIWPSVCNNLNTDHTELNKILAKVRALPYVKNAFIGSGVRYDICLRSYNKKAGKAEKEYIDNLIRYHTSGRLKVAPEHTEDRVLKIMRKPSFRYYNELVDIFRKVTARFNLKYSIIPYFISSHPGSEMSDMAELATLTKKLDIRLEQVQDFTPTPGTIASAMYYTGIDPYTGKKLFTARSVKEKRKQNRMFFWYKKENAGLIRDDLRRMGREDLIKKLFSR